jgi:hypothetical protein
MASARGDFPRRAAPSDDRTTGPERLTVPFTPFHLGPGAALKALGGGAFSFLVFGGTQVLMDLEPGIRLLLDAPPLHGPTHSFAGAVGIGAVAVVTGKPITELVLRRAGLRDWRVSWTAAISGAFLGSLSHVLLDAVMHGDMHPFFPLGAWNPWYALLTFDQLHALCMGLGALGLAGLALRGSVRRLRGRAAIRPRDGA